MIRKKKKDNTIFAFFFVCFCFPISSRGERILPDIYMDSPGVVNSEAAISVMEMIASVIFSALSYMTELVEQDVKRSLNHFEFSF